MPGGRASTASSLPPAGPPAGPKLGSKRRESTRPAPGGGGDTLSPRADTISFKTYEPDLDAISKVLFGREVKINESTGVSDLGPRMPQ
jgi:hypothetical protein